MAKVHKISVLNKMIGRDRKSVGKNCFVPQNSVFNLQQKPYPLEAIGGKMGGGENSLDSNMMAKAQCPHCENMAKNFLYLESLVRNHADKKLNCSLCNSSLKYLQYVNRNIMKVFGDFDSIVQAAKAFSTRAPLAPKYEVKTPKPTNKLAASKSGKLKTKSNRVKGGANVTPMKSMKTLNKSKSGKSLTPAKSGKSLVTAKSGKSLSKQKSGVKSINHTKGKMVLKSKYQSKSLKQSNKMVRSASQYNNKLRGIRSKSGKPKKPVKKIPKPVIPWGLLKRNMRLNAKKIGH